MQFLLHLIVQILTFYHRLLYYNVIQLMEFVNKLLLLFSFKHIPIISH